MMENSDLFKLRHATLL